MKCLKVDEYIKRTASVKETELLRQELEVSLFTTPFKQDISSKSNYFSLVVLCVCIVCIPFDFKCPVSFFRVM